MSSFFKVIYVGGPRQVGKTTMLQRLANKHKMNYVTLDNLEQRREAQRDPELFLQKRSSPLLIDEAQYAPDLFSYIKIAVDQTDKTGQYWLTGSQQFTMIEGLSESLAGRVGIVNLLGFSVGEIEGWIPASDPFWPGRKSPEARQPKLQVANIFDIIINGGFPPIWRASANKQEREQFFNTYVETYVERDLRTIFGIEKTREFHSFIQLCAARTGQLLSYSDLARDASISVNAARQWISILESTSQIYLLYPYYANASRRLVKSPKLYFLDTGLAAHLTKWHDAETLLAGAMAGAFLETFVIGELVKSYLFRGKIPPLYFLRDRQGHEVDVLVEREQKMHLLEIKLKSNINLQDVKGMIYHQSRLPSASQGAVISLTAKPYALSRSIDVLPIDQVF